MRTSPALPHPHHPAGHVILLVLVITACLTLGTIAYVKLIVSQNSFTVRSQVWHNCMPLVEAGIEDALGQITTATNANLAASGWGGTASRFAKTNTLGDGYYVVTVIFTNANSPVIHSTGHLPAPLTLASAAHGGPMVAAAATQPAAPIKYVSRTVEVILRRDQAFPKALIARSFIDFNGNNVKVDSYRSSDPKGYEAASAGDRADVFINGDVKNSGNVGNANIKGKVTVGPKATFKIGPNGCVGSVAWHSSPGKGVEQGWLRKDANVALPPVDPPWSGGAFTPTGNPEWKYILDGGDYELSSLNLGTGEKMRIKKDSVLYVKGNINITGEIEINPGSKLRVYCAGANCSLQGTYTKRDIPADFQLLGLPALKNITANGFAACIYAPNASMILNGNNQFYGSAAVDSLTLSGNSQFHYDEDLSSMEGQGYLIAAWNEL